MGCRVTLAAVYTIPSGLSFLDVLAAGLWDQSHTDPFQLTDTRVFLPTRRACLAMRDSFLRHNHGQAALLPRMQPLGDVDDDDLVFYDPLIADIPPPIAPLRRRLLLTRLIAARDTALAWDQAALLADALARFLDEAHRMRCDFGRLATLVEAQDLAAHWQQTVQFLSILTQEWPRILAEEGCLDPADHHNRVMAAQIAAWQAHPPSSPVIAAGSTGTQPATADFLKMVASLPQGAVILPGLAHDMDEESWQALDESHPQYAMKHLLEVIGVDRTEVRLWGAESRYSAAPRARLIQESMRPAEVTDAWRHLGAEDIPREAMAGLARIEADHPQEEAQIIGLILRATLEEPAKTAALVTPDRDIAERVAALMGRWGVALDDSAGASLAARPVGAFLTSVLAASSPRAGSVAWLSLMKYPLTGFGLATVECRRRAREVERHVWRTDCPSPAPWLEEAKETLASLTTSWNAPLALPERIAAHIRLAEQVAMTDTESGADRLWCGDEGDAAATWLNDLRMAARDFPDLSGEDYAALFAILIRSVTVRPTFGQHPRLSILGPREARLIAVDRVILAGMNEGAWPPEPSVDPWMSRPMRQRFGLPSPEYRIGQAAHDFMQLANRPDVFLTRSRRAKGTLTLPSRFVLQMETVLAAAGYHNDAHDSLAPTLPWTAWARCLDAPSGPPRPCPQPNPRPPLDSRPRQLSVTDIGLWRRNPYAIYAKHILHLRKLDPLEAERDAADRGTMIHEALHTFILQHPRDLPADALARLLAIGRTIFAAHLADPHIRTFWWPRFERIAEGFVAQEQMRRAEGIYPVQTEVAGRMMFGTFTLTGRVDRIDRLPDGHLAILDYKTGTPPSHIAVAQGLEPQLPLLALIAAEGGFPNLPPCATGALAYWHLTGRKDADKPKAIKGDPAQVMQDAREGLEHLIASFADPSTPYQAVPKAHAAPRYDDYAHLARLAEWGRTRAEDDS